MTTSEPAPERSGFDADFLSVRVQAPAVPGPAGASALLPYTHFTVCLNTRRRLAWWVAWNIDGLRLHPGEGALSRDGLRFVADTRVPPEQQALDDVYAGNRLDRGHVARRADLLWGTLEEAKAANVDSFTFPNITPQMDVFNQSGQAGRLPRPEPGSAAESWGLLENAVLAFDGLQDRRLSVLGGPVLDPEDPVRFGLQVPREFWKVVVYRVEGALRSKAFVLTQDISVLGARRLDYLAEFDTYEVTLADLGRRTGLDLSALDAAVAGAPRGAQDSEPVRVRDLAGLAW